MFQSVDASTTGAYLSGAGTRGLAGARLVAGSTAATAIIRETDGSGRILAKLSASAANVADDWEPTQAVAFSGNVHVTLTGTSPQLNLFEA